MKDANTRFVKQQQEHSKPDDVSIEEGQTKQTPESYNEQQCNKQQNQPNLAVNYYRSVPPPMASKNIQNFQKNTDFKEKRINSSSDSRPDQKFNPINKNPNHNIHKIIQEFKTFNNQISPTSSISDSKTNEK